MLFTMIRLRSPSPKSNLTVQIAMTRGLLAEAYELVYRSYHALGYVQPHPGQIVYHEVFGRPESRTLVAMGPADKVVGTLTIVEDGPLGLQAEKTFPEEVQGLRKRRRNFAEITCLTVDSPEEFPPTAIFFALTRFMIHYAYWRRYDDVLLAVHPRHYRLYWRCFRAFPLGPCRPYDSACGSPAILSQIDLRHLRANVDAEQWQQYFAQGFPEAEFAAPAMDPRDHRYFCDRQGLVLVPGRSHIHEFQELVA